MLRLYNDPEERVRPIISVVLDAVERDECRFTLEKFGSSGRPDDRQILGNGRHLKPSTRAAAKALG